MKIELPLQIRNSVSRRLNFVGSCNALQCFSGPENSYLWNPAVNRSIVIPNSGVSSSEHSVFGFGSVPRIDDYKLVRAWCNLKELAGQDNGARVPMLQVEMYSLNGALEATPTMMDENMGKDNYILAFNMDTETCREITPPKFCDKCDNGLWHSFLGVFKESLSLFSSCHKRPPYDCFRWEIWVMNERSMVL
ncbi:uncharacterized protein LOC131328673 [Rhododendron vialii]|uniref:uncharacterized protein LOC131328673 n=1 Tax=Rhododendron vialii TaxID=182163 RepID=UPI0026605912|nr:uncharacterized protein LOC131328673 [Rhododendron vialii]